MKTSPPPRPLIGLITQVDIFVTTIDGRLLASIIEQFIRACELRPHLILGALFFGLLEMPFADEEEQVVRLLSRALLLHQEVAHEQVRPVGGAVQHHKPAIWAAQADRQNSVVHAQMVRVVKSPPGCRLK